MASSNQRSHHHFTGRDSVVWNWGEAPGAGCLGALAEAVVPAAVRWLSSVWPLRGLPHQLVLSRASLWAVCSSGDPVLREWECTCGGWGFRRKQL